jgi:RimJ/RimL family protein N-acetyltransferase
MIEKPTGRFIGAIGFNRLAPIAEIAYHLTPASWGQGYALEALTEALFMV